MSSKKGGVGSGLLQRDLNPRATYWLLIPLLAYPFFALFGVAEDDTSGLALFSAMVGAFFCGLFCRYMKGWLIESVLAGAWFPVLLAWGGIYWRLGIASPAGAAQNLAGDLGWSYAPAPLALAVWLAAAGLTGHLLAAIDLEWKRLTGRRLTSYIED